MLPGEDALSFEMDFLACGEIAGGARKIWLCGRRFRCCNSDTSDSYRSESSDGSDEDSIVENFDAPSRDDCFVVTVEWSGDEVPRAGVTRLIAQDDVMDVTFDSGASKALEERHPYAAQPLRDSERGDGAEIDSRHADVMRRVKGLLPSVAWHHVCGVALLA
jgi:hypothetical protein